MTSLDQVNAGAMAIKKELDDSFLAFKTYSVEDVYESVKKNGGIGTHATAEQVELAFFHSGLLLFPWDKTGNKQGYTRVYRAGSLIAGVLNAMRYPGTNSDDDLSKLISTVKAVAKSAVKQ